MAEITIQQVRDKYPQYSDMSDQQLADALHSKFYADMPKDDFYSRIGLSKKAIEPETELAKSPEKSVGGFIKNAAVDTWEGMKNIAALPFLSRKDLISGLSNLRQGASEVLETGANRGGSPQKAAYLSMTAPLRESVNDPSGIPGRLVDYAYEKPFSTAMNLSTLGGVAGKTAEATNMAKTASMLGKASELTNPVTVGSRLAEIPINAIAKTGLPESIYARTMKMPPGSLKEEGREQVLKTLVRDEQLPLGRHSVDKINAIVGDLEMKINDAIDAATVVGAEGDITKVAQRVRALKAEYANRPEPEKYYRAIDRVADELVEHDFVRRVGASKMEGFTVEYPPGGGTGKIIDTVKDASFSSGKIPLSQDLALKKGIYEEIQSYYMKGQKPETGRIGIKNEVDARAKAEAARALRQEVLDSPLVPEAIKADMSREAGLMNARKWVERATNRGGNLDPVSMSGFFFGILVEKGLPATAAWRIAMSQPVLSRFAIGLAKTRKPIRAMGANAVFQAGQLGELAE